MINLKNLQKLCQLIRYDILTATTKAGSGHPTSSLSVVELMTTLFFGGFLKYDLKNPQNPANDRVIFSKGHATPLLYALYHAAGVVSYEELLSQRQFGSRLEGHPTPRFPYVEAATGSLGQGLSVGVGMALGVKLNIQRSILNRRQTPRIFVLLGDSEVAEGQIWEAAEIASYYKLDNLIAILDVNRLGQRGETMLGWDLKTYENRFGAFGWRTILVKDGNSLEQVYKALVKVSAGPGERTANSGLSKDVFGSEHWRERKPGLDPKFYKPTIVIAKTVKGKGVSFLENQNGWHGKALTKDQLNIALKELGKPDLNLKGKIIAPNYKLQIINNKSISNLQTSKTKKLQTINYKLQDLIATREAYGDALVALGKIYPELVVLDAEVSNSTYSDKFKKVFPNRFLEMFIAEQNMISAAVGLAKQGYIPFCSSFAAFLTRAFDQLRMAQYSVSEEKSKTPVLSQSFKEASASNVEAKQTKNMALRFLEFLDLKIVGSHAGVSIGYDGPSQMGLEDIAMARSILKSVVFYPSDATSTFKLTEIMAKTPGIFYLRTTREKTPVIYPMEEKFVIGGSKIHYSETGISRIKMGKLKALIIAAGITLYQALIAQKELAKENIQTVVLDCYSVKPLDEKTIVNFAQKAEKVIVVEDHYPAGGLGETVKSVLINNLKTKQFNHFIHLAVRKIPRSGSPEELLTYEEIDSTAIIKAVLK
ncbi:MAG: transketolase family protein [Microgenomates group bacterium]|nr:transketolase family protein [Microgenomates group bacterium]